ncbi:hypothetical protein [Streptomyces griseosporeus]
MRTHTITATAALMLALTACSSGGDETAKPSASPSKVTAAPGGEASATPSELSPSESLRQAQEDFEQTLKDIDNSLGETVGVQEGTYEITNTEPSYDDPFKALDDEYLAPGTYTTKGPSDGSSGCYWARMGDASGESIISNDLTTGRAIVQLEEGDFFKTSGCKPWTHSGD